jgi:two-component system cell cycle sensor histidine kinase/response regulator CckA
MIASREGCLRTETAHDPPEEGAADAPGAPELIAALRRVIEGEADGGAPPGLADLEQRLRHGQKWQTLGRAAMGVAHEFNNLLSVITGFADILKMNLADPLTPTPELDEIRRATERAAALTRQLLTFGRHKPMPAGPVCLHGVVAGVRLVLHCLVGHDTELRVTPHDGPCRIRVNPGEVEQVLLNLVLNARDATAPGGRIEVTTGEVRLDAGLPHCHGRAPPGRYARLTVSDTGCGMDEPTRARLFEPLFTTKEPGKGTGLGLAIIAAILKRSGGSITVWSEPGRGTRFDVYWPCAEPA